MDMTITTAEDLWDLPDGTILRHPKFDSLVERFHRTPAQITDRKTDEPTHDCIRVGGHLQNLTSLRDWDFPMVVLYRPDHTLADAWDEGYSEGADDERNQYERALNANPYRSLT